MSALTTQIGTLLAKAEATPGAIITDIKTQVTALEAAILSNKKVGIVCGVIGLAVGALVGHIL